MENNMRYIGFLKEYGNIKESQTFSEAVEKGIVNDSLVIEKIVNYLDKGTVFFGWMHYFEDLQTKKPVAPHMYYTDGEWIWPSYFSYYLKKYPNYFISTEFIEYLTQIDFKIPNKVIDKNKIEKEFVTKLKG
jgi:hypothetical protein